MQPTHHEILVRLEERFDNLMLSVERVSTTVMHNGERTKELGERLDARLIVIESRVLKTDLLYQKAKGLIAGLALTIGLFWFTYSAKIIEFLK